MEMEYLIEPILELTQTKVLSLQEEHPMMNMQNIQKMESLMQETYVKICSRNTKLLRTLVPSPFFNQETNSSPLWSNLLW